MLHLCTYGCLLPRPLREDRGHLKCRIRLSKATRVNLTATRYSSSSRSYVEGSGPVVRPFAKYSVEVRRCGYNRVFPRITALGSWVHTVAACVSESPAKGQKRSRAGPLDNV